MRASEKSRVRHDRISTKKELVSDMVGVVDY